MDIKFNSIDYFINAANWTLRKIKKPTNFSQVNQKVKLRSYSISYGRLSIRKKSSKNYSWVNLLNTL